MGERDGLFALTVTYFLVLLWVDEASGLVLLPPHLQQAFSHPGDALLASPVLCSKITAVTIRRRFNSYIVWD